jgi:hypothetical protein
MMMSRLRLNLRLRKLTAKMIKAKRSKKMNLKKQNQKRINLKKSSQKRKQSDYDLSLNY